MTENRLYEAMRDTRYRRQGNPERDNQNTWVKQAWRTLIVTRSTG